MLHLMPVSAEIFVLTMTCITLMVSVFVKKNQGTLCYWLAQFTLVGALVITSFVLQLPQETLFNGHFIHDRLGEVLKLFIYLSGLFVFVYSRRYIAEREIPPGEYFVLALFSVLGMQVLVAAGSFLTLFLGVEIVALPIYALVAIQRNASSTTEAAVKYFVLGALASGMLLYGISMIYGATETLELAKVGTQLQALGHQQELLVLFGMVFLLVGVAFKFGAVPFHMWVPDVYQGAPASVTMLITSAPKIAALGLAFRLLILAMPSLATQWQQVLLVIAIASIVLGNLAAIAQSNLKRMLAYSSVAHVGYMSLGLLAATPSGYASAMFYMISYALMSLGAFGLIVLLSSEGYEVEKIEDLQGLNSQNSWLALMMLFVMFSMAGIPPLVGFIAKLQVLEALIRGGFVWLAAFALIFAVIGSYYYIRVVKVMYFEEPAVGGLIVGPMSRAVTFSFSVNGIIVLILGIFPSTLINLCKSVFGG
jgi:NADH-quinone oxidoreductase subunit N